MGKPNETGMQKGAEQIAQTLAQLASKASSVWALTVLQEPIPQVWQEIRYFQRAARGPDKPGPLLG